MNPWKTLVFTLTLVAAPALYGCGTEEAPLGPAPFTGSTEDAALVYSETAFNRDTISAALPRPKFLRPNASKRKVWNLFRLIAQPPAGQVSPEIAFRATKIVQTDVSAPYQAWFDLTSFETGKTGNFRIHSRPDAYGPWSQATALAYEVVQLQKANECVQSTFPTGEKGQFVASSDGWNADEAAYGLPIRATYLRPQLGIAAIKVLGQGSVQSVRPEIILSDVQGTPRVKLVDPAGINEHTVTLDAGSTRGTYFVPNNAAITRYRGAARGVWELRVRGHTRAKLDHFALHFVNDCHPPQVIPEPAPTPPPAQPQQGAGPIETRLVRGGFPDGEGLWNVARIQVEPRDTARISDVYAVEFELPSVGNAPGVRYRDLTRPFTVDFPVEDIPGNLATYRFRIIDQQNQPGPWGSHGMRIHKLMDGRTCAGTFQGGTATPSSHAHDGATPLLPARYSEIIPNVDNVWPLEVRGDGVLHALGIEIEGTGIRRSDQLDVRIELRHDQTRPGTRLSLTSRVGHTGSTFWLDEVRSNAITAFNGQAAAGYWLLTLRTNATGARLTHFSVNTHTDCLQ